MVRYRRVPLCRLGTKGEPKSRADSAAYSRAVRRLEARGLVLRINRSRGDPTTGRIRGSAREPAPGRSDCLVLTESGEEVAHRLQAVNVQQNRGAGSVLPHVQPLGRRVARRRRPKDELTP